MQIIWFDLLIFGWTMSLLIMTPRRTFDSSIVPPGICNSSKPYGYITYLNDKHKMNLKYFIATNQKIINDECILSDWKTSAALRQATWVLFAKLHEEHQGATLREMRAQHLILCISRMYIYNDIQIPSTILRSWFKTYIEESKPTPKLPKLSISQINERITQFQRFKSLKFSSCCGVPSSTNQFLMDYKVYWPDHWFWFGVSGLALTLFQSYLTTLH